jgi:hypothetical protein
MTLDSLHRRPAENTPGDRGRLLENKVLCHNKLVTSALKDMNDSANSCLVGGLGLADDKFKKHILRRT